MMRPGPPKTKKDLDLPETLDMIIKIQSLENGCDEQTILRSKLLAEFENWYNGISNIKKATYVDPADAKQAACQAFDKAILNFDPKGGAKFSTFASTCINNAILDLDRKGRRILENEQSTVVSNDDENEVDLIDNQATTSLTPEEQMDEKMLYSILMKELEKYFSKDEINIIIGKLSQETTAKLAEEYEMEKNEVEKIWRKFNSLRDRIRNNLGK
ncbi:MAG: sigma-70 family RNA polymerase sigma factor [Clostridia bacterium]|nr:sigma-70 family RNA polymerase sigma factor [Clostridia bacterium]